MRHHPSAAGTGMPGRRLCRRTCIGCQGCGMGGNVDGQGLICSGAVSGKGGFVKTHWLGKARFVRAAARRWLPTNPPILEAPTY
eukprot:360603-Chlamydomonas_euryale.AAC.1